jgi:hypothetical protein
MKMLMTYGTRVLLKITTEKITVPLSIFLLRLTNKAAQWPQHNCELQPCHWNRLRGSWKGGQDGKESVTSMFNETENIFHSFNFDTIGGIFIHWLLHYTVFSEPKELYKTLARTRYFYNLNFFFTSDSIQGLGYLSVCAIASRSSPPSPPSPKFVFLTVI